MRPPRSSIAVTCIVLLAAARATADLAQVLLPRVLSSVRRYGTLSRSATGGQDLRYLPAVACGEEIRRGVDSPEPSVVVEFLALARLPGRDLAGEADRLVIYNALRSVSRLEGLEYYSASRRQMRVLYRVSHRIVSPSARQRMADPLVSAPPAHDEIWVYQEDTTFGGNVYAVTYDSAPEWVLMRIANQSTMRSMLLPLVRPGNMVLHFLIVPDGEELLFYAAAAARLNGPWARASAVQESFSKRVEAMYRWFAGVLGVPQASSDQKTD